MEEKTVQKYRKYRILSTITLILPLGLILLLAATLFLAGFSAVKPLLIPRIPVIIVCLALRKYMDKMYLKYREQYEFELKLKRQMKAQHQADMDRLVGKKVLNQVTKPGSKNPEADMDKLVGLAPVKEKMRMMAARMEFDNKGKSNGIAEGRHMVFFGSPGTGKTTAARIITGFLFKNKNIKENRCLEIDGNFLKANTPADTAIKVKRIIDHAEGGVLFIDEAYSLLDNACGDQAIATLLKEMEDRREAFILIMAGYQNEMKRLLDANPGFHSRIKEYLNFPDYTTMELREIFCRMANEAGMVIDSGALDIFDERIQKERKRKSFGNARTVRSVLDDTIDHHALNLSDGVIDDSCRYRIMPCDINPNVDENRI
jgi:stage V sporulation protein K